MPTVQPLAKVPGTGFGLLGREPARTTWLLRPAKWTRVHREAVGPGYKWGGEVEYRLGTEQKLSLKEGPNLEGYEGELSPVAP